MNLTEDQRYFMDILETAGFVRAGGVYTLILPPRSGSVFALE